MRMLLRLGPRQISPRQCIVGLAATTIVAAIFWCGAARAASPSVSSSPQGNWVGTYGGSGYDLAAWNGGNDVVSMPGASIDLLQGQRWVWGSMATDARALESVDESTRVAATYWDWNEIRLRLSFSSGFTGSLELYALDADNLGRRETITVNDQTASLSDDFTQGAWVSFPVSVAPGESVSISVDRTAGLNAVLSGLFLDSLPVGDAAGWHQQFAEDFTTPESVGSFSDCVTGLGVMNDYCSGLIGTPYFSRWFAYPDGWTGTPSSGTYDPSRSVSVHDGLLDYYLHTTTDGGTEYHVIDAMVPKIEGAVDGGGLLYGRYIVRARWDPLSSYHISFLLWPDSDIWPADGEIDFPEANMGSDDVSAFMHHQGGSTAGDQDAYEVATDPGQWHVYEIDWLPGSVSFFLDGQLVGRSTTDIPDTPMHWVLQTNTSSALVPGDTETGHLQVDWAVAYTPVSKNRG